MNELSAAMGLNSLENLDEFINVNRSNYLRYREELKGLSGVRLFPYDEHERCNYQYVALEIDEAVTKLCRDELVVILHAENVVARRYFYPGCHRMEPYRSYYPNAGLMLPVTEQVAERVLALPTGTAIRSEHISKICKIIRTAIEHAELIRQRSLRSRPGTCTTATVNSRPVR